MDPNVVRQLKEEHGDELTLLVSGSGDEVVVKPVSPGVYKRFRSESSDPKKRDYAIENLCRAVVVHPDRVGFDALLQRRPGLCEEFAEELLNLVGITTKAHAEKL